MNPRNVGLDLLGAINGLHDEVFYQNSKIDTKMLKVSLIVGNCWEQESCKNFTNSWLV